MQTDLSTRPPKQMKTAIQRGAAAFDFISCNRSIWYSLWAGLILMKLVLAGYHPEPAAPDEGTYTEMARQFLEHHQYLNAAGKPTSGVMPGYPMMLAAMITIGRGSPAPMYYLNALLTLIAAWAAAELLFLTTRNRRLSRICMLVVYLYSPMVTYAWHLLTEIPYTAALTLLFLFWERTRQNPLSIWNWFFLGLFTVTSFMIRPVMFLLTPIYFAWPLIVARLRWRSIVGAAVGTTVVFMLWTPWIWHNHKVFGGFIPLASTSGMAFYTGTLPDWSKWSEEIEKEMIRAKLVGKDELTVNKHFGKVARQNIARDPLGYLWRVTSNSWRFWPTAYSGWSFPKSRAAYMAEHNYKAVVIKLVLGGINMTMIVGMLCSFVILRRQARWWPYMMVLVYFHVMHAMIMPIPRYSLPLTPMILAMILGAADTVWARRSRTGPNLVLPAAP